MKEVIRKICYGIILVGVFRIFQAWHLSIDTFIGYYVVGGALLVLGATFIPWKSLFSGGSVGHRAVQTTHSGPSKFAQFGGWFGKVLADLGTWVLKNIIVVAGFALIVSGMLFWWFAPQQEDFKIFTLAGLILNLCGASFLLYKADMLETVLKGWSKHGLRATGFVISLLATVWLAHNAYFGGTGWGDTSSVSIAAGVTFLFGLATVGLLKAFLEACGKGIASFFGIIWSTLSGKYSLGLAMIMWGALFLVGGFAFISGSKMELFEDFLGLPQVARESVELFIAIGWFLVVFSVLAFMVKGKK